MIKPDGSRRVAQLTLTIALAFLVGLVLPGSAHGAGASYVVLQCHDYHGATDQMDVASDIPYPYDDRCSEGDRRIEIRNSADTVRNQGTQYTLTAPPGTSITELHFDANLRRGSGHHAEVGVWNGSSLDVLMSGPDSNPSWRHADVSGLNHPQLVIRLFCTNGTCPEDVQAHVYVRNIVVGLADWYDPARPDVGGSLVGGGWLRGAQSLRAYTSDPGSGVSRVDAWVNGAHAIAGWNCDTQTILPWPYSGRLVPCGGGMSFDRQLDTAGSLFRNGANSVSVQAFDFPGNASAPVEQTVYVDNALPGVAFANSQDAQDPELIRAPISDEHSGIAGARLEMRPVGAGDWQALETRIDGGQAQGRVDSAAFPAGEYEFRVTATDIAGNSAESTRRQNGEPMRLSFPLRGATELQAHLGDGGSKGQTVPYGTKSSVSGRLLDASGEPLADKEILILENFGDGALIRERPTKVTTNDEGRFSSAIPAGPTRRVTASFAGTQKHSATDANVGELTVKSRASFKLADDTVPEGGTAIFKGKVGHFGARIPSGGKLIELQVRLKTGRWDTVGQAFRTKANGRYERHYRFGKHYTQDALFRFRVKVQKEGGWPYKRAASKQRKLIVRAG